MEMCFNPVLSTVSRPLAFQEIVLGHRAPRADEAGCVSRRLQGPDRTREL